MRKILGLVVILIVCGCQGERKDIFNIEGFWYGDVKEGYEEKYVRISFEKGIMELSPVFFSYTSGWYDSKGTYVLRSDGGPDFDITMTPSDFFKDHPDIPIITVTHAELAYSDFSGELLKVHYTKQYREDYFNKELSGTTEYHWVWFSRERPDFSPEE